MIFADQQLLTVLAILTVSFAKLRTVTEYHFEIIICLVNLGSVVQNCTIDILRDEIRKKPAMAASRGYAVLLLMALVLASILPSGNQYWLNSYGMPALCIWKSFRGNYDPRSNEFGQMMLLLLLQVWGTLIWFGEYFPSALHNRVVSGIMAPFVYLILLPRRWHHGALKRVSTPLPMPAKVLWSINRVASRTLWAVMFVFTEVIYSEAFDLLRSWGILINMITELVELRSYASDAGRQGNEDAWGFGQAVPVFLLILPLFALVETLYGMSWAIGLVDTLIAWSLLTARR